ncbi:MAG: asparagine--tRNA ligase [Candidatus Aenigmarchaeota archaeon]|nr:asparagine--tRNA ligase [Candidatus Aenigmarchaeota archaeon]
MNIDKIPQSVGKDIEIKGWVYRKRDSKDMIFLVIRDAEGTVQTVVRKEHKDYARAEQVFVESSVIVRGTVQRDERSSTGYEILLKDLEIVCLGEPFPIGKDLSVEYLLDVRHLWLRSQRMNAMLKIRSTVFDAVHHYFRSKGFYEFHSPVFQATQCEGGSDLFEVKYFDDVIYLAQTWQLYAEAGIFSLEKIYTIAPSFRAEKSKTSRHLTEYWHAEMEMTWNTFKDIQDHGEALIKFIMKTVLEKHAKELEILERDVSKLQHAIDKPFVRMTYTNALKLLKEKCGMDVEWGKDLRTIEEEKLTTLFDVPIIVSNYPKIVKAFYMLEDPKDPRTVQGCDFLAPEGYGEIIGGSQREMNIDKIRERLVEMHENPDNYGMYLDTRRFGSVPHGGFGMGVERIVRWICGFENIKDAIPFPRTMQRRTP